MTRPEGSGDVRSIYLEMAGTVQSYFKSFISNPPEGYRFSTVSKLRTPRTDSPALYDKLATLLSRSSVPTKLIASARNAFHMSLGADLTITNGILDFRKEKWMVFVEDAYSSLLGSFDRRGDFRV